MDAPYRIVSRRIFVYDKDKSSGLRVRVPIASMSWVAWLLDTNA